MYSPVRLKRATNKIEQSKIHWLEEVNYKLLFTVDSSMVQVKNDIMDITKHAMKTNEKMAYFIRNRALGASDAGEHLIINSLIKGF